MFRVETIVMPENESEISIRRYRILANLPIQLKWDSFLIVGAEYNNINFNSEIAYPFENEEIENLHVIDLNLGYLFKWNEDWRFVTIAGPRLASNFKSGIQKRDFKLNVAASFWKEKSDVDKPFRIVLGLSYNTSSGLPIPLPVVSYFRRFHPNWSFSIGIPKNSIKYYPAQKHTIEASVFLDGYFANSQNDLLIPGGTPGDAISQRALIAVTGYQYNITKNISFYTMLGHTLFRNGTVRDINKKEVFETNSDGSFYLRGGFKFAIF